MTFATPSRTTGTSKHTEIEYVIYYGPSDIRKRNSKRFHDESVAIKFFNEKQDAKLHVDAYKVTNEITSVVEKLT